MQSGRVTGLYIYPVKSCRGISLTELDINSSGPENDRQWMIVDESNQFLTLRTVSRLAEIKTALTSQYLELFAGGNKILVDRQTPCEKVETVTVWNDSFLAGVENKSINEALSDFLSKTVKLVRYQKESFRELKHKGTDAVKETRFADSRPILLTNESSLQDLNKKLQESGKEPSYMERFRPNIVVSGFSAFAEDDFQRVQVGESVTMSIPKLCGRCPVITQDVETGKVVSKETLQLLAGFRRKVQDIPVPFGLNLTPESLGKISVGDSVTVL